jgi:prophage regulatory protein
MNQNLQRALSFAPDRLIRKPDVLCRTGLGNTTLYALIKQGRFPASFRLACRAVAWREADVDEWIANRIAEAQMQKVHTASTAAAPILSVEKAANDDPALGRAGL